jgi:hypothetical protein
MSDTIRYFRNVEHTGEGTFPDGIVRVITEAGVLGQKVEYLDPPAGLEHHQFYAKTHELSRITSPLFDVGQLWIIVHPKHPSFYLNGAVLGIVSNEHAARIAADIVGHDIDPKWHVDRVVDIIT